MLGLPVWAAVIFTWAHGVHDDPHAVPRGPVHFLALLAVVVPDAIGVLFVKLVRVNVRLGKFASEELDGIFQR